MKIHHIGYAVAKMEDAIKVFISLGFEVGQTIADVSRDVYVTFAKNGNICVELVSPINENSPVESILKKNGASPYHICYIAENISEQMDILKKSGWNVVHKPSVAPAMDNKKVSFMYHKEAGIIELVED